MTGSHHEESLRKNIVDRKNPRINIVIRGSYNSYAFIFSHPDYTVGTGITPVHANWLADFTAGGELRPAPKTFCLLVVCNIALVYK